MLLHDPVPAEAVLGRVEVLEEFWRAELARVGDCVRADVVLGEEIFLGGFVKIVIGGARICEVGVAAEALTRGWDFNGAQARVRCTARIERGVDVEEEIPLRAVRKQ